MPELIDPLGNRCVLPMPAHRIVSLVPSQTELLADLGLDAEVVGMDKISERFTAPPANISSVRLRASRRVPD